MTSLLSTGICGPPRVHSRQASDLFSDLHKRLACARATRPFPRCASTRGVLRILSSADRSGDASPPDDSPEPVPASCGSFSAASANIPPSRVILVQSSSVGNASASDGEASSGASNPEASGLRPQQQDPKQPNSQQHQQQQLSQIQKGNLSPAGSKSDKATSDGRKAQGTSSKPNGAGKDGRRGSQRPSRRGSDDSSPWWRKLILGILPDLKLLTFLVTNLVVLMLSARILSSHPLVVKRAARRFGLLPKTVVVTLEKWGLPANTLVSDEAASAGSDAGSAGLDAKERQQRQQLQKQQQEQQETTRISFSITVPFSEFLYHVKKDNIVSITVDGDKVSFVLRRPEFAKGHKATELQPMIRQVERMAESKWKEAGEASGKKVGKMPPVQVQLTTVKPADVAVPYAELMSRHVEFGAPDKASFKLVNTISSTLLYAGIAAVVLSRLQMKLPQFGGKARSQKGKAPPVLFADVAGVDEAKEELEEIVEYLRTPERFTRLGARPPRGVLLVGPPGTGKTMLAKAVAGEADVPFISCSGSEFVELYVGLGASRVRELFAQAKKDSPSIVFIDEIDAVAKVRDGRMRSVGNDEREQTLNQLLTEMDGFDSSTAVIVLAATNRADVIDPALRRPGRFDRIVAVEPPDRKGREAILTVHVEHKELPLSTDVDIQEIAVATSGFTGADLANLVNEAALLAARRDHEEVTKQDFDSAVERALAGIEKKRSALGRAEKAVVARHEAGHALLGAAIAKVLPDQRVVQKISIVPRSGGALGFAYMPPPADGEERLLVFVDELRGQLAVLLGGRAAEDVCFGGRISTGAVDDIRRATDVAYKAVAEYGLSGTIGPMSVGTLAGGGLDGGGGFSWGGKDQGRLSDQVQDEVQQLLQAALEVARAVLVCNKGLLEDLGRTLQDNETVEGAALSAWLAQVEVPPLLRTFVYGRTVDLPLLPAESSEEDV